MQVERVLSVVERVDDEIEDLSAGAADHQLSVVVVGFSGQLGGREVQERRVTAGKGGEGGAVEEGQVLTFGRVLQGEGDGTRSERKDNEIQQMSTEMRWRRNIHWVDGGGTRTSDGTRSPPTLEMSREDLTPAMEGASMFRGRADGSVPL